MNQTQGKVRTEATEKVMQWYQVPVVWVALGVFALFLAACIHIIVISRGLETPEFDEGAVFRVPLQQNTEGVKAQ